jgi:hypothetical protein
MPKLKLSIADVRRALLDLGERGSWRDTPQQLQFLSHQGAVLNWSLSTGTVWAQGIQPAGDELLKRVERAAEAYVVDKSLPALRTNPTEVVEEQIEEVTISVMRRRSFRRSGS